VSDTSVKSTQDAVDFLKSNNVSIKTVFAATLNASDNHERGKAFFGLRGLLAVHVSAEVANVWPACGPAGRTDAQIVHHRYNVWSPKWSPSNRLEGLDEMQLFVDDAVADSP
jgi:hypothetical protein